jgi:diguanylate cyclase (GGDEF)-like protein
MYTDPSVFSMTLPLHEAADYLGVSQSAMQRVVERGELRPTTSSTPDSPAFDIATLDDYLEAQHARAVITGKLTMPLKMSVDVPSLLSTMVAMRDEREAAAALAEELRSLAGSRCPAVAILRVDEVMQCARLLVTSDFPERESFPLLSDNDEAAREVDVQDIEGPLRTAVTDNKPFDSTQAERVLAPVMGDDAQRLCQRLHLNGAIVYPLMRIGTVRWMIAILLEGDPLEIRPETRDAIEALGIQASIALEAVRLRADVLHRANRAEALYGTVRMLARSEDSGSLLERIASLAARLLTADAAIVLTHEADTERFHPAGETGLDSTSIDWSTNLSSAYLVGRSAGMTTPLQVTDASRATTLNMPRLSGNRQAQAATCAPIIHKGELLGAIEVYSATPRSFSEDDMSLLSTFAHQAAIAINSVRSQEKRRRALFGAVEALASANEARDGYTGEHCKRLADLAVLVARELGFSDEEVERIGLAAALHDIGKIAVPDAVLRKPGALTDEEREIVNLHPTTGEEIVARVPELHDVAAMIGAHQERWDGHGYPRGLAGEEIPIGARIIAVVDTYAALIEDRPYRKGASHEDAVAELVKCAGTQFDARIVDAFVAMSDEIKALIDRTDELVHEGLPIAGEQATGSRAGAGTSNNGVISGMSLLPGRHPEMHRATELAALNDLIRTIASTRDLRKMYERMQRQLSDILDVDALLLLLSDGGRADSRQLPELHQVPFFPISGNPVYDGVVAPVARLKRTLWVNDYIEFMNERGARIDREINAELPRSVISTPIVIDGEFLGLLSVQALHPDAYDKRHVGIVEDIALHLGVTLRHSHEFVHSTSSLGRGATTGNLTSRLIALGDAAAIARAFIEEARVEVSFDGCLMYLLNPSGEPVIAATDGYYTEPERQAYQHYAMPRGSGFIWSAIEHGAAFIVPRLLDDIRSRALVRPPGKHESALVAPLVHDGEVTGVVFLTRENEPYTEADKELLAPVATSAAAALTHLTALSREQQRAQELGALQRAIELVTVRVDRDAALKAVVDCLGTISGYRLVSLYLLENATLRLHAQIGYDNAPEFVALGSGVMGRVVHEGRSLLISDVSKHPEFIADMPGVCSLVCVPILVHGEVNGVLTVETGRERKLSAWDQSLVELFAQQAGVAFANITRYEQTVEQALLDPMTNLPNQAAFLQTLQQHFQHCRQQQSALSLLFLDLDNFKLANDAFGHRFGDELLAWMGDFLPRALPPYAYVARYGGEEFVVILPKTLPANAECLAEKLRAEMADCTFETSLGHSVQLSSSIGVAGIDLRVDTEIDADDLIHAADRAMYAAKLRGRNRVVQWSPEIARFVQAG